MKVQNLRGTINTFDISSDKQSKKIEKTNEKSPVQGQKSAHGIFIEDNSDKNSKKDGSKTSHDFSLVDDVDLDALRKDKKFSKTKARKELKCSNYFQIQILIAQKVVIQKVILKV